MLDTPTFFDDADAACVEVLMQFPDLDTSLGLVGLRAAGTVALDALGEVPMPDGLTRVVAEDTRTFLPEGHRDDVAILWIHGGGLAGGEPRMDDLLCADLALTHRVIVTACRYRLAPENPYPAGLQDCLRALKQLLASYPSVLLAGASAGGGLAIATAMLARDEQIEGVRGVVAYYPMLDDRDRNPSMQRATMPKVWNAELNRMAWSAYLSGADEVPVYAAPARASVEQLRGLPPIAMDIGTVDGFFDETLAFTESLARAGVAVDLCVTPGAFHASERLAPTAVSSARINAARHAAYARLLA